MKGPNPVAPGWNRSRPEIDCVIGDDGPASVSSPVPGSSRALGQRAWVDGPASGPISAHTQTMDRTALVSEALLSRETTVSEKRD